MNTTLVSVKTTMKRMRICAVVDDVEASIAFYTTLIDGPRLCYYLDVQAPATFRQAFAKRLSGVKTGRQSQDA